MEQRDATSPAEREFATLVLASAARTHADAEESLMPIVNAVRSFDGSLLPESRGASAVVALRRDMLGAIAAAHLPPALRSAYPGSSPGFEVVLRALRERPAGWVPHDDYELRGRVDASRSSGIRPGNLTLSTYAAQPLAHSLAAFGLRQWNGPTLPGRGGSFAPAVQWNGHGQCSARCGSRATGTAARSISTRASPASRAPRTTPINRRAGRSSNARRFRSRMPPCEPQQRRHSRSRSSAPPQAPRLLAQATRRGARHEARSAPRHSEPVEEPSSRIAPKCRPHREHHDYPGPTQGTAPGEVRSDRGFTLLEVLICVGLVVLIAAGAVGATLSSRSLAVTSAAAGIDALLDAARTTARQFPGGATIAFAPDAYGDGFVARLYENRPGVDTLTATTTPPVEARVLLTETETLGAPAFAIAIHANGKVSGFQGNILNGATSVACPTSGRFHLAFAYAGFMATRDIPCRIDLATTGPIVYVTPIPATPQPSPSINVCAGPSCVTLPTSPSPNATCPPGHVSGRARRDLTGSGATSSPSPTTSATAFLSAVRRSAKSAVSRTEPT